MMDYYNFDILIEWRFRIFIGVDFFELFFVLICDIFVVFFY